MVVCGCRRGGAAWPGRARDGIGQAGWLAGRRTWLAGQGADRQWLTGMEEMERGKEGERVK